MLSSYYAQDGITIYHGKCEQVLPFLEPVDLVLTDPPYGIGIASNPVRQKHTKQDWDNGRPPRYVIDMAVAAGRYAIVWGGNYFDLPPSRAFLVWDKVQPAEFSLAMVEQAWCSWDGNAKKFTRRVVGYHKVHPTQKPVELMQWCIEQPPETIESVCDPFMGAGTTLEAAKLAGIRGIGIEVSEEYCEKAANRLRQGVLPFAG